MFGALKKRSQQANIMADGDIRGCGKPSAALMVRIRKRVGFLPNLLPIHSEDTQDWLIKNEMDAGVRDVFRQDKVSHLPVCRVRCGIGRRLRGHLKSMQERVGLAISFLHKERARRKLPRPWRTLYQCQIRVKATPPLSGTATR